MSQRVRFGRTRSWNTANITADGLWLDTDANVDTLIERYEMLHSMVNSSPPVITEGDECIQPLAIFYCRRCRGTRSRVAHCSVERSRAGRGAVFLVQTLRDVRAAEARIVPVVIAAPAEIQRGRLPTPRPRQVLTECRTHGALVIDSEQAVGAARRTLARLDGADDTPVKVPRTWVDRAVR